MSDKTKRVIDEMSASGFVYCGLATWRDEHGQRQYGGHFVSVDYLAQKHAPNAQKAPPLPEE